MRRTLLCLLLVAACDDRFFARVNEIERGTDKSEVIRLLGEPEEVAPCDGIVWWYDRDYPELRGLCVTALWYGRFEFDRWVIGLDADGKVISKKRLVSP